MSKVDKNTRLRNYFDIQQFEVRNDENENPVVSGYASVFNKHSVNMGGWKEVVRPGAFKKTIQEGDVRALWNHNTQYVLGRTKSNTLKLEEREEGLYIEAYPPNTTWARDLMESINRGDINQMSIGFNIIKHKWNTDQTPALHEVEEIRLHEVSVVSFPAFPDTSVNVREAFDDMGLNYEQLANVILRSKYEEELNEEDYNLVRESITLLEAILRTEPQEEHSGLEVEEPSLTPLDTLQRKVRELELLYTK